jgi:hypothetical protein
MITDGIVASQLSGGTLSPLSSHGASAGSAQRFAEAHERAVARLESGTPTQSGPNALNALLDPLMNLNSSSTRLAERSGRIALADLKPSDLMMLTMRSQEFLFNCQLVANVANRSSDGVQQLFKQQS